MQGQGPDSDAGSGGVPPVERVHASLAAVLRSAEFRGAGRSREFLDFVVRETVAGRGGRLTERTVARGALGLPSTFDARLDASVRVRASRVRAALERYYAGDGRGDDVIIVLPRGSYIPRFVWRWTEPLTGRSDSSVLVSVDSSDGGLDGLAADVRVALVGELSRLPALVVASDAAQASRYRLAVRLGGDSSNLLLELSLVDGRDATVVWRAQRSVPVSGLEAELHRIAVEVGDYGGTIPRRAEGGSTDATPDDVQAAVLAYYRYVETRSIGQLLTASEALEAVVRRHPDQVVLLCYLGASLAEQALYRLTPDEQPLVRAVDLAAQAADIDPASPMPDLVLAVVALARGDHPAALQRVEDAAERRLDPSLGTAAAVITAAAGDIPSGVAMLRHIDRAYPTLAGYRHVYLSIERLLANDGTGALAHATLIPPAAALAPLLHALSLHQLGHHDQAQAVLTRLGSTQWLTVERWHAVLDSLWDIPAPWRAELLDRLDALLTGRAASP